MHPINLNKISGINDTDFINNNLVVQKIDKLKKIQVKCVKIHFSFFEIIRLSCCLNNKLKKKKEIYNECVPVLNKYLDVSNLVKKLDELEKLKMVLLNKQQLTLFNFVTREVCSDDMKYNTKLSQMKNLDHTIRGEEIDKILEEVNSQVKFDSELDKKL